MLHCVTIAIYIRIFLLQSSLYRCQVNKLHQECNLSVRLLWWMNSSDLRTWWVSFIVSEWGNLWRILKIGHLKTFFSSSLVIAPGTHQLSRYQTDNKQLQSGSIQTIPPLDGARPKPFLICLIPGLPLVCSGLNPPLTCECLQADSNLAQILVIKIFDGDLKQQQMFLKFISM